MIERVKCAAILTMVSGRLGSGRFRCTDCRVGWSKYRVEINDVLQYKICEASEQISRQHISLVSCDSGFFTSTSYHTRARCLFIIFIITFLIFNHSFEPICKL